MLTCIIVDDEQACVETLHLMLEKKFAGTAKVVATANKPADVPQLINIHSPDLLFLDIEMPHITGIELLQSLQQINFDVIFTTAHQHYALQAIKLNALDYLLKPINVAELSAAINKCISRKKQPANEMMQSFLQQMKSNITAKKIALPSNNTVQFVPVNEIIRIESQSNYSIVYFIDRPKLTIARTLKEFEEQLQSCNFLRVHHSHLINMEHIIGYKNVDSGYVIMKGNDIVEISRRKKQEVFQRLNAI